MCYEEDPQSCHRHIIRDYIRCGYLPGSTVNDGYFIGLIYVNKIPSIPENCVVTTSMLKLFQTHYSNSDSGYFNYPRLYTSQLTNFNGDGEAFINGLTWNNLSSRVYYGGGTALSSRTTIDYTKCKTNTVGLNHEHTGTVLLRRQNRYTEHKRTVPVQLHAATFDVELIRRNKTNEKDFLYCYLPCAGECADCL